MPAMDANLVRNVGIMGHSGVGKTTLIEHMLNKAGKTSRIGTVEEGNTVGDYYDEERERQQTLHLKLMHCEWKGSRIHFVDTPGYADFVGETAAVAPVLDAIVIVVDATAGIQTGTDNALNYAIKHKVPHAFFVNKLDREHTDFNAIVKQLRENYGKQCIPMIIPVGQGPDLKKVISVLEDDLPPEEESLIHGVREQVSDVVAEAHEELLEKYLETGQLSHEEFAHGLQEGIEEETIIPVLAGSVEKDAGMRRLLDLIHEAFPSPLDRHIYAQDLNGETVEVKPDPEGPFLGQVFRSVVDPFVGQITLFRVLSGTLATDSEFYNVTRQTKERTGKIFMLNGKEQEPVDAVGPGDLAAMHKLKQTRFGDTIAAAGTEITLPPIEMPESMVKLAIVPKSRADEDKIGEALNKLAEEDPTFLHYRDEDTGEHLIRGMGDLQLEMVLARMASKFRVEADTKTPKVAYKETIRSQAEAHGRHKKQTGGHGQFGDVHIRFSPNERGAGYEFIDSIVGGVVPRQYIPAVDKGLQESLLRGVIAGYPVVDVKCELFFGSYHDVDSSEMAFKTAASIAVREGIQNAQPGLLEPIMHIEVTVPEEFMGDVNGDLNSRRGRILGMEALPGGRQRISAHVPEAEVLRYATDLRSMSQGRGAYTLRFDHYDFMPEHEARQIIEQYEADRAEGGG